MLLSHRAQEVAVSGQRLQQLLDTVPWRLARAEQAAAAAARAEAQAARLRTKNATRRRQNELGAARKQQRQQGKGVAGSGGDAEGQPGRGRSQPAGGMGWQGPPGKGDWRRRKLRPPGTLERKF
jgi:hypothetical protein